MTTKKRIVALLFCCWGILISCGCSHEISTTHLTQEKAGKIIKNYISDTITAYGNDFGLSDLDVVIEFKEFEDRESYCSASIRPFIVCPSLDSMFEKKEFDDNIITKRGSIRLDFGSFDYNEKTFIVFSAFIDPVFKTSSGGKYIIGGGTVLEYPSQTVIYQTKEDAEKYPNLSVGTQLGETNTSSYESTYAPAANCPNCGSGYRENTVGARMIQEKGYCPTCNGR